MMDQKELKASERVTVTRVEGDRWDSKSNERVQTVRFIGTQTYTVHFFILFLF